jgi:hypothetical protein
MEISPFVIQEQREMWAHGNDLLLKTNPSQQDLAAALIQFQRAVELRDKLLDKLDGFEKIPGRCLRDSVQKGLKAKWVEKNGIPTSV